jgi:HSP20 family protein
MVMRSLMPWSSRGDRRPGLAELDDPFEALHRNMDQVLDAFRRDFDFPSLRSWDGSSAPSIDVSETDEAVVVEAELPGMDAKEVELSFQGNSLVLKGEKTEEKESKEKDFHIRERRFGSFQRMVPLPPGVDVDKAKAEFEKGVLRVRIPKTAEAKQQRRKIEIKAR